MRVLVESAGSVLFEDGARLHMASRPSGGTAIYVAALLAFILGANGVVQLLVPNGSPVLSAAFFAASALALVALRLLAARRHRARAVACDALPRVATLDLAEQTLSDGAGRVLAPLGTVVFRRTFQVGSSSKALQASWRGGSIVLARGSPLAGSVDPLADALRARGLSVA